MELEALLFRYGSNKRRKAFSKKRMKVGVPVLSDPHKQCPFLQFKREREGTQEGTMADTCLEEAQEFLREGQSLESLIASTVIKTTPSLGHERKPKNETFSSKEKISTSGARHAEKPRYGERRGGGKLHRYAGSGGGRGVREKAGTACDGGGKKKDIFQGRLAKRGVRLRCFSP